MNICGVQTFRHFKKKSDRFCIRHFLFTVSALGTLAIENTDMLLM
jgi:hypothetical protein